MIHEEVSEREKTGAKKMGENYHCAGISYHQNNKNPKLSPVKLFLKSHSLVGVIFA